jgi:hypothetical protein
MGLFISEGTDFENKNSYITENIEVANNLGKGVYEHSSLKHKLHGAKSFLRS